MTQTKQIQNYVDGQIGKLSAKSDAYISAQLAQMRRGAGRKPGAVPETWAMFLQDLPEGLMGSGGSPSREEKAIYHALTLYSLHQQGRNPKSENVHHKEFPLGRSLRMLIAQGDLDGEDRILRKMQAMASVNTVEELVYHLKSMIGLLRKEGIPLDYAGLARDLYVCQFPGGMDENSLRWGRDFYKTYSTEKEEREI